MAASQRPRFAILLPTRNGGRFLRTCIDSVVDQSYDSLELVVSDNANEDETPEILRSYDDPRLRAIRSKSVLSVTDNWNAALTTSTGEYILMIGDDDLLLPDCCATLDRLLAMHHNPDCLSYNAYRFIAPDAIHGIETAYYGEAYFKFEPDLDRSRFLEADLRRSIVRDMFRFRTRFPLTMQIAVVRRDAMDRLPNAPFQPPFPDHYALAALLLTAETWAHAPVRPLVVGVSSKSFGHFFFNAQDMDGLSYLGIRPKFDGMLPGNDVLNVLATWLLQLKADFSDELDGVEVDWPEYTIRQIWAWIQEARQSRSPAQLASRLATVPRERWPAIARRLAEPETIRHAGRVLRRRHARRTDPLWSDLRRLPDVTDIGEFGEWLTRHKAQGGGRAEAGVARA